MSDLLFEWVKKLGQQHWSRLGEYKTLCDKPMLGNNYANVISEDEKIPCENCLPIKMEIEADESNDQ